MSEPEIARRCHACGASIRDRAFFCPQCGISFSLQVNEQADTQALSSDMVAPTIRQLAESNNETSPHEASAGETMPLHPPTSGAPPLGGSPANLAETQPLNSEITGPAMRQIMESNSETSPRETAAGDTLPLHPPPGLAQRPGGSAPNYAARQHRMKQAQPPKEGRVGQRVERLRKISTVVIDQAAYDPSLRFILVAGFLFLIFLIIVVMNRIIG